LRQVSEITLLDQVMQLTLYALQNPVVMGYSFGRFAHEISASFAADMFQPRPFVRSECSARYPPLKAGERRRRSKGYGECGCHPWRPRSVCAA